jgi:hypothetical protein
VFAGDEDAGRIGDALGDLDLLDLVAEDLLDDLAEILVRFLGLFELLLFLLALVVELEAFLGDANEFFCRRIL